MPFTGRGEVSSLRKGRGARAPDLCSAPDRVSLVPCLGAQTWLGSPEKDTHTEAPIPGLPASSEHSVSDSEISDSRFNFMNCIIQEY